MEFDPNTFFSVEINYDAEGFIPSPKLVHCWITELIVIANNNGLHTIYDEDQAIFHKCSLEIVRKLRTVIENYAKLKTYEFDQHYLSFNDKFIPDFETIVINEFLLSPVSGKEFLKELLELLVVQTKRKTRYFGRWGSLVIDDNKHLMLKLIKRKRRTLEQSIKGSKMTSPLRKHMMTVDTDTLVLTIRRNRRF